MAPSHPIRNPHIRRAAQGLIDTLALLVESGAIPITAMLHVCVTILQYTLFCALHETNSPDKFREAGHELLDAIRTQLDEYYQNYDRDRADMAARKKKPRRKAHEPNPTPESESEQEERDSLDLIAEFERSFESPKKPSTH